MNISKDYHILYDYFVLADDNLHKHQTIFFYKHRQHKYFEFHVYIYKHRIDSNNWN